jgi:hypothetical protein
MECEFKIQQVLVTCVEIISNIEALSLKQQIRSSQNVSPSRNVFEEKSQVKIGQASSRRTDEILRQTEEDLERLRAQLAGSKLQNQSANLKGRCTIWVHVLRADPQREPDRLIAKIDTQSSKNWVAGEIIERLELQGQIQEFEPDYPNAFQGATGEVFQASGHITLKWYHDVVLRTRETQFLVNPSPNAPFDLILGESWIESDGWSSLADPVLAIRAMGLTEGWVFSFHESTSRADCDRWVATIASKCACAR